jgi:hypothetical protein
MTSESAVWVCEWRVFSDRIEPRLRGKAAKAATIRTFHNTKDEALREQERRRLAHAGNLNFVSSVVPWVPSPKARKASKPGHRG